MKKLLILLILIFKSSNSFSSEHSCSSNNNKLDHLNEFHQIQECLDQNLITAHPNSELNLNCLPLQQEQQNDDYCKTKVISGCEFTECVFPANSFTSYPKPIAIYFPKSNNKPTEMKIHFHGHSHFNYVWDRSFRSMLDSFQFGKKTCNNPKELLIVPYSENNQCNHFHDYLTSKTQFENFMNEINTKFQLDYPNHLTLSGHSGGGKVIGKILENNIDLKNMKEIELYDALYSTSWSDPMAAWIKKYRQGAIKMYTSTTDPIKYSNLLLEKVKQSNIGAKISHKIDTNYDHWQLCKQYFE